MPTLTSVTDNYFTSPDETYSDNLSSSISAAATTVPVNNASVYATGEVAALTVDVGEVAEATFIGEKDTTNQFINCIWTEGDVGVGHSSGATIQDLKSATDQGAMTKGLLVEHNQDGTLKDSIVATAKIADSAVTPAKNQFPTMVVDSNNSSTASVTSGAAILSVELTAGTWLIVANSTIRITANASSNSRGTGHIGSNPGTETDEEFTTESATSGTTGGTSNNTNFPYSVSGVVSPTSTTTYSIWFDGISASAEKDFSNAPAYLRAIKLSDATS